MYSDYRRTHLPFCLVRQSDGTYVTLNRNYHPLGAAVRLSPMPDGWFLDGMSPMMAACLSFNGSSDMERILLYNDTCAPENEEDWKAYAVRLAVLGGITVCSVDDRRAIARGS